jgi:hypothetical protein
MMDKRKIHENNIKAFMSPICHLLVSDSISVPDNLPKNIHILDLSNNFLVNSSLETLKNYGKSLTFLSLANNNITYINESIPVRNVT